MFVEALYLKNYRNYSTNQVVFSPHVNIIIGDNAQGKTNLVEAIYVLGFGKSFRTQQDKELIKTNENFTHISIYVKKKHDQLKIDFKCNDLQKKEIKINYVPLKKLGELMGVFNVVIFSPEDLQLVKGTPALRRKFMDKSISQIYPRYYHLLIEYNKILKQRNNLLKQMYSKKIDYQVMAIWDEQLADCGSKLMKYRIEFLEKLKRICFDIHYKISNGSEKLTIEYFSNYLPKNLVEDEVYDKIYIGMLEQLKNRFELDIKRGYTSIGPHRDDLSFFINDDDSKKFGSQGQVRTTALSLKLSEIEIIKNILDEKPVLILDDVLSELDHIRQNHLISYISDIQTFITTTEINSILNENILDAKIIQIVDGSIV